MLKICTIGIGNAGNQIADLAKSVKGIPGVAINSSEKDLTNVQYIPKLIVGDTKGAGKNRDTAKKFIREQCKNLLSQKPFIEMISEQDVVFVISSIGGGTGSGMAPMLTDIMSRKFPDVLFVIIGVYPPLKESIAAQQNGLEYLKEVKDFLPNIAYMAYDNNRRSDLPTSEMMKEVNNEIVEHLDIIRGQYLYPTPYNSIDEKDMVRILSTPGRLAVYYIDYFNEKDLDKASIEEKLIDSIKAGSSNVELDRDKLIKRFGIVTNLSDKLNSMFNSGCPEILELIGEPVEAFEHIYINHNDDEINRVVLILSGLSIPDDRLTKIVQRIDDGLEELGRQKESSVLDDADMMQSVKELRGESSFGNKGDFDLDDLFAKYE